ncbi:unnamed protein product, partial [Prorocentrum cordatum]
DRLKAVLTRSFMFSALEPNDLNIVVGAMKEVPVSVDESVFDQGDAGDFLFVIESGKFDCVKDDVVVKTCEAGDVFGELALLYNCPRAATVRSKETLATDPVGQFNGNTLHATVEREPPVQQRFAAAGEVRALFQKKSQNFPRVGYWDRAGMNMASGLQVEGILAELASSWE